MSAFWIIFAIASAVVSLAVRDLAIVVNGKLGPWLIKRAALRVPKQRRDIRVQEWMAEFDCLLARGLILAPLTYSIGVTVGAVRIHKQSLHRHSVKWLRSENVRLLKRLKSAVAVGRVGVGVTFVLMGMAFVLLGSAPESVGRSAVPVSIFILWIACNLAAIALLVLRVRFVLRRHREQRDRARRRRLADQADRPETIVGRRTT